MTPRAAGRLVWSLWALALVLAGTELALFSLNGEASYRQLGDDLSLIALALSVFVLSALGGATLGALIAVKRPANPVGWLLLAASLGALSGGVADEYAVRGLIAAPGSVPGADWAVHASNLTFIVWVGSVLLVFWFFPTGRLPSLRWRSSLAATIGCFALMGLTMLLIPGTILGSEEGGRSPVENPIRIAGLEPLSGWGEPIFGAAAAVALALTLAVLSSRFRRSRGEERAQVKWLLYAGAVSATALVALGIGVGEIVLVAAYLLFGVALPLAAAIAIFKYRLYDIDRIINRTLVYALLTALLAGIYVGGVIGLGAAFRGVTGQSSGLAVAISTLVVAALFRPARSRIQAVIDSRFYRTKYDAARALEEFSATLRDEVDLDALSRELLAVVEETIQPAHVSVWLRTLEVER